MDKISVACIRAMIWNSSTVHSVELSHKNTCLLSVNTLGHLLLTPNEITVNKINFYCDFKEISDVL